MRLRSLLDAMVSSRSSKPTRGSERNRPDRRQARRELQRRPGLGHRRVPTVSSGGPAALFSLPRFVARLLTRLERFK